MHFSDSPVNEVHVWEADPDGIFDTETYFRGENDWLQIRLLI